MNVRIWKVVVILLGIISLSSGLLKTPGFWSGISLILQDRPGDMFYSERNIRLAIPGSYP
jgi:hypothetical protein